MLVLLAGALAQTVVPTASFPPPATDPCAAFTAAQGSADRADRRITAGDLATLTDIGRASTGPAPSAFGLSPDGTRAAILVRRANPEANAYCETLLVVPHEGDGQKIDADRGGEFIQDDFPLRGFTAILAGWPKPNTPRWAPDGSAIAYLKRVDGDTQIWLADPAGHRPANRVTRLPDPPDRFVWTPDGSALVVATRPGIRLAATAIAEEGRSGFLFDDRFSPQFADRPIPTGEVDTRYERVSLADGSTRPASEDEIALLTPPRPAGVPAEARSYTPGFGGYSAWLEPKFPKRILSPTRLVVRRPDGITLTCDTSDCEGIREIWWSPADRALYFQAVTGWGRSQTALQRWTIGDAAPRKVAISDDVFIGCSAHGRSLICAREGSLQPRRLVAIDMRKGTERLIFDPNPGLRGMALGTVQRLRFRNAYGIESFADLVLPPDHMPGDRHPLVIVQYRSSGFLRGGTGDEVPILPLAARGFAVLSFERPYLLPEALKATTEAELYTRNNDPWADRRQVHSSLMIALDLAIATGSVDPERIGISGLSDGSSTTQFALANSDRFKAAALGSCCEDIHSFALAAGPAFTRELRGIGYRYFDGGADAFWAPMSLIRNADRIATPILIQTGDSEYEGGLDVVEAWSHKGKAIELYVFPGEPHFKWQPAHRLAMYARNVAWFEFWLMNRIDCDPANAARNSRWLAMEGAPARSDLHCAPGTSPGP